MEDVIVKDLCVVKSAPLVAIAATEDNHVNAQLLTNLTCALLPWARPQRRFVFLFVMIAIEIAKEKLIIFQQSLNDSADADSSFFKLCECF